MDLNINGKIAFISGASSGLGEAIAISLAKEGVNIALCARREDKLTKLSEKLIKEYGVKSLPIVCDMTKKSDIEEAIKATELKLGSIDILINNTGGPPSGTFDQLTTDDWEGAVNQLLYSFLQLTRLALPKMKENKWGRIINITSVAVKQPVENLMLSNSIRAAITGFAKTLSGEVGKYGITVNNIMPGFTKTQRLVYLSANTAKAKNITIDEVYKSWEAQIPLGRVAEPEELANIVTFIASNRASYITGSSIQVDGGSVKSLL